MRSPSPINHSANYHPDTEKKFTYATHKLPNFTEMITLHKSKNAASAMSTVMHDESDPLAISNNLIDSDSNMNHHHLDETHADNVFHANLTISDQLATSDNFNSIVDIPNGSGGDDVDCSDVYDNSESINCTANGSTDDIMSMDIIFDNAPIEIDTSIGSVVVGSSSSSDSHDTVHGNVVNGDIIENAIITPTHIEQVDVDGHTYQILTLDEPASSTCNITNTVTDVIPEPINDIRSTSTDNVVDDMAASSSIEHTSYQSNKSEQADPVVLVRAFTNGNSTFDDTTNSDQVNGSVEVLVSTVTEPLEQNDENADDGQNIFDELAKASNAEAEKERLAKELEERRRKRKPLPVLAIKYKRRRPITNKEPPQCPPSESKVPMDLSTDKSDVVQPKNEGATEEATEGALDLTVSVSAQPASKPTVEPIAEPTDGPPTYPPTKSPTKPSTKSPAKPTARSWTKSPNRPSIKSPVRRLEPFYGTNEIEAERVDRNDESIVPEQNNEQEQANDTVASNDSNEQSDSMNSLVVVESQDPNDPSRTTYAVHIRDPVTNEVSEQPLDLPDEVIQRIRQSMG